MSEDLNDLSSEDLGALFPVIIVEYDPVWKDLFSLEKRIICETLESEKN
jgi:hypothetical protein